MEKSDHKTKNFILRRQLSGSLYKTVVIFSLLFIITLPFPYKIIPDIGSITSGVFERLAKWTGEYIFGLQYDFTTAIISDSTGMYLHVFNVLILSLVSGLIWGFFITGNTDKPKMKYRFSVVISYYLALQLLIYGLDKVFKHQFFFPETNTMYTSLGFLSKDILYWSTLGTSYSYNVFLGLLEVFPAVLLLFRKTRMFGALIAFGVLLHVVVVNFSFDINVKVYATFLLFCSLIILSPYLKTLYAFLIKNEYKPNDVYNPEYKTLKEIRIYSLTKPLVIGLILFESLFIYFKIGNFNDDLAKRDEFNGAYIIQSYKINNKAVLFDVNKANFPRRVFFHRKGYLIFQNWTDEMNDYKLQIIPEQKLFVLTSFQGDKRMIHYQWNSNKQGLLLKEIYQKDTIQMEIEKIKIDSLPIMDNSFHWTIDSYN